MPVQSTNDPELDKIDLHILALLTEEPLWKQRVADRLQDIGYPETTVSVQTAGRRISRLRDHDYVTTRIIDPDDIPRSLIPAYTATDKGRTALDTHYICTGCELLQQADDHVCDLQPAGEFFAAKT